MIFNLANDKPYGHRGITRFSPAEMERRRNLMSNALKNHDCDLFITQGWFPTATMGCFSGMYWLTGRHDQRNTMTVLATREGDVYEVPGVKTCCNFRANEPYTGVEDMSQYIKGAKRIAYDGLGYITAAFRDYLTETAPGVEIIDFSNQFEKMKAVKSAEEIACIEDAVAIQDKIFASAANFIYPGRSFWEITADVTRQMTLLGADPTLMGKVLIGSAPNRGFSDAVETSSANAGISTKFADDPNYRLQADEYVGLLLESQGSGGYYASNSRNFFFSEPHPEIRQAWDGAVEMLSYTATLLKPGMTGAGIHELLNQYKVSHGFEPVNFTGADLKSNLVHGCYLGEISGIGINTIDRPQPQFAWEDIILEPGHSLVIYSGGELRKGPVSASASKTCIVTDSAPRLLGSFPLELVVL